MNDPISILLIEDDVVDQMAMTNMVAKENLPYTIEVAQTVTSARRALSARSYDVILADYKLPDGNAFDLLDLLLDKLVIFTTGSGNEETAIHALRTGIRDYLIKDPERHYLKLLPHRIEICRRQWRVEHELIASMQLHRAILDSALDAIVTMDAAGLIVEFSPSAERMFGYIRSEAVGQVMADLIIPPAFREQHRRGLARYLAGGQPVFVGRQVEMTTMRRDGTEFPVELCIQQIDMEGSPLFTGFIRDITERKRAEVRLRESEARFRVVADSIPVLIWMSGLDKLCIFFNKTWLDFTGRTTEQEEGNGWAEGVHADDLARCLDIYTKSFDTRQPFNMEYRLRRHDGEFRWVGDHGVPRFDASGVFVGYIGSCVDISERKQGEAALKLSEFSVQNASLPTFWIARDARILRVNRAACDHLGYTEAELLSLAITDLDPDFTVDRWPAHWEELRSLKRMSFETRQRHKDGHIISIEVDLNWFEFEGQEYNFAFVRDLTERRKQERLALRSQRMESIGTLAGGIAHDLNNALAPIMMSDELLRMKYPGESRLLDTIETSTHRAADMVRQLLTFAKGAEGVRAAVHPVKLVRELEDLVKASFPKNINLVVRIDPKLATVLGDATQLHQVLLNLCVNARDAMPDGGTLTLQAGNMEVDATYASSVPDARPGKFVTLSVRDTGMGIPPEILDRILEPFFTTKDPDKGTGLGLSTCLGIVKGHGGFLQVNSQPGQGATFTAFLPIDPAGGDSELAPKAAEKFHGQGETVLFVDDEVAVRDVGRAVLLHLGFNPLTATDGADGLMKAAQHRTEIRAIISDLHMPRMDGLSFVREVRLLLPDIPIVVASGRMDDAVDGELQRLGVPNRLDKPFTEAALAAALRNLLATEGAISSDPSAGRTGRT